MPDIDRFVAYIYLYENSIRIKNTGFVKIYKRDGECRIEVKLRGVPVSSMRSGKIYLFSRDRERLLGTQISDLRNMSNAGMLAVQVSEEDVRGSGLPFSEMKGMIIQAGDGRIYATEWDDLGVQVRNFAVREEKAEAEILRPFTEEPVQAEMSVHAEPEKAEETPEAQAAAAEAVAEETEYPVAKEADRVSAAEEKTAPMEEEEPQPAADDMPAAEAVEEREKAAEAARARQERRKCRKAVPLTWNKMAEQFQLFPAFEDDEIQECIRIQPKDLAHLPKKEWVLGNNSFMLHGYYNYKYLMMGRKSERGRECVVLGVPGVYHQQERAMATMFGFPHFKPAKKEEQAQGVFGYWYRIVAMNEESLD